MCQSKAEGGRRCMTHLMAGVHPDLATAYETYREARNESREEGHVLPEFHEAGAMLVKTAQRIPVSEQVRGAALEAILAENTVSTATVMRGRGEMSASEIQALKEQVAYPAREALGEALRPAAAPPQPEKPVPSAMLTGLGVRELFEVQ